MWKDLKQAAHVRKPPNMSDLELPCTEEWAETVHVRYHLSVGLKKLLECDHLSLHARNG